MDEDVDIEDNLEENIKNFARLTAELQWITLLKIETVASYITLYNKPISWKSIR